jgi:hypothetical protein
MLIDVHGHIHRCHCLHSQNIESTGRAVSVTPLGLGNGPQKLWRLLVRLSGGGSFCFSFVSHVTRFECSISHRPKGRTSTTGVLFPPSGSRAIDNRREDGPEDSRLLGKSTRHQECSHNKVRGESKESDSECDRHLPDGLLGEESLHFEDHYSQARQIGANSE